MILGGKDRGKIGKINEVVRSKNWVFVEGLNTVIHSLLTFSGCATYT